MQSIPRATARAFQACSTMDFFSREPWYLAGGTALALQTGHRKSVDLDFFIPIKTFDEKKVEAHFATESGGWATSSMDKGTVYGKFFDAKMSLIAYPFFAPAEPMRLCGHVSLVSPKDIAVMKIIAISQRGRKRDFFDLYWLCQHVRPLLQTLECVHKQYTVQQNMTHILKSMVYFDDAEDDPEPTIYFRASWKTVKAFFRKEVVSVANHLIR